jgi:hypothetical protein
MTVSLVTKYYFMGSTLLGPMGITDGVSLGLPADGPFGQLVATRPFRTHRSTETKEGEKYDRSAQLEVTICRLSTSSITEYKFGPIISICCKQSVRFRHSSTFGRIFQGMRASAARGTRQNAGHPLRCDRWLGAYPRLPTRLRHGPPNSLVPRPIPRQSAVHYNDSPAG